MNWLMTQDPIVLAAVTAGLVGGVLLLVGWRGRLMSGAEFCSACGQEVTPRVHVCPECGTSLRRSSLRIAFEMEHPLLARLHAVTHNGRRMRSYPQMLSGCVLLAACLVTSGLLIGTRITSFNWYSLWSSQTILKWASSAQEGSSERQRYMAELESRKKSSTLDARTLSAYATLIVQTKEHELRAAAQREMRQPATDPILFSTGITLVRVPSRVEITPADEEQPLDFVAATIPVKIAASTPKPAQGLPSSEDLATLLSGPGAKVETYADPSEHRRRMDQLLADLPANLGSNLNLASKTDALRQTYSSASRSSMGISSRARSALPLGTLPNTAVPGLAPTFDLPSSPFLQSTGFVPSGVTINTFTLGASRLPSTALPGGYAPRIAGATRLGARLAPLQ